MLHELTQEFSHRRGEGVIEAARHLSDQFSSAETLSLQGQVILNHRHRTVDLRNQIPFRQARAALAWHEKRSTD